MILSKLHIRATCASLYVASFFMLSSCGGSTSSETEESYKTMEVVSSDRVVTSKYPASIKGKVNVENSPQISGLITQICVDEGAKVKKGEPLFILNQVPYQSALETALADIAIAEAKVANAEESVQSKRELLAENIVSEYDLRTAINELKECQALLKQAQASETNARNSLSYTVIQSPVDGVTGMIGYKVGALVSTSSSEALVTVSSEGEMYAYFSMTESQVLDMTYEKGSVTNAITDMPAVRLELSNGATYELDGRIDAISGTVEQNTGAVRLRALFANPDGLLRNGGSALVIVPYHKRDVIVIPQQATYEIQDKVFVYKVVDGKTVASEIKPFKINNGKEYIVESGLSVGDVIIAEGAGLLREGVKISINKE